MLNSVMLRVRVRASSHDTFFYNSDRINPRIYQGRYVVRGHILALTIFVSKTRLNPLYTWLAKKIARAFSGFNFGLNFGLDSPTAAMRAYD